MRGRGRSLASPSVCSDDRASSPPVSIEVFPLEGLPEVRAQDDLAILLSDPLGSIGVVVAARTEALP